MNILEAFESMEAAPRGNARLEVLQKVDSPQLRKVLTLTLSPQITFGVKQLPAPTLSDNDKFLDDAWYEALTGLLTDLSERTLTGNEAQSVIAGFLGVCTDEQRKWSERILKQDLRLNMGAKDVNKTLGEGTIFQFDVPLAVDYMKVDEKHYKGRWAVEPKLDGARCVAYLPKDHGLVRLYSRSGKEYINFESVRVKLQEINNSRNPVQSIVLDGEVVSYVAEKIDFQALQHTLFRHDGVETGSLRFLVFDGSTQEDWENPSKTYEERYDFIKSFIGTVLEDTNGAVSKLGLVEMFVTIDPDRTRMLKHNFEYVNHGFEGAMYRRLDASVLLKRSRTLMKVKSFQDDEATLEGVVMGTGKYDGILGALQCKTKAGKEFEIGSGFSDEQRRLYWNQWKQKQITGGTLTNFKYQELTDDGIPRFPIFKGFRHTDDTSNG